MINFVMQFLLMKKRKTRKRILILKTKGNLLFYIENHLSLTF